MHEALPPKRLKLLSQPQSPSANELQPIPQVPKPDKNKHHVGLSKESGPFLGVPIIRTIIFDVLFFF